MQSPVMANRAPAWFDTMLVMMAVALGATGVVGLALAVSSRYRTDLTLLGGALLTLPCAVAIHRQDAEPSPRAHHRAAGLAVLIALAFAVFAGATPSQNTVITRDPASYQATGRQLAQSGGLEVDARGKAFAGIEGLRFSGAAVFDMGKPFPAEPDPARPDLLRESGMIETQFNHMTAVVLAMGYDVGGYQLMFRLPALASALFLLGVYACAARFCRSPYWALLAPAILAVGTPLLYVSRNTYSEPFAAALLWASLLLAIGLHDRPRVGVGAVAGLLIGAVVCTRVDALVYLVLAIPMAGVSIGSASTTELMRARAQAWLTLAAVAGAASTVGWFDLLERSGRYPDGLNGELTMLRDAVIGGLLVSVLGVVLWRNWSGLRRLARWAAGPTAVAASVAVGALLLFGWFVRPLIQEAATSPTIAFPSTPVLQKRAGLPIQPLRTYDENSLRWMSWYLGAPALAVAIGTVSWVTFTIVRRRASAAATAIAALCIGAGGIYFYKPNVTPQQLWATRRFIPAAFPSLAILVAVGAGLAAHTFWSSREFDGKRWVGAVGAVALAGLLVVPAARTTWPVREQTQQRGYLRPVLDVCDALPDDAAVVVAGGFAGVTMPGTLRAWCGVPVAAQGSALDDGVDQLASGVASNGYRLFIVSLDRQTTDSLVVSGGPTPMHTSTGPAGKTAELTLIRPPSGYDTNVTATPVDKSLTLWMIEVQAPAPG